MPEKIKQLEAENTELKAQLGSLSALNSALYAGAAGGSDEIDLRELWQAIWSGKWLIISITSVFAIASVLTALLLPNEYSSTVILAPASTSSSSSLSKLASQFGGLASIAGLNLGATGNDVKTTTAVELVKTWGFIESFIKKNEIEVEVFAATDWNRLENTLVIDDDLYNTEDEKWTRSFDPDKGETAEPSSWELYEEFKDRLIVNQDGESGFVYISVEYYSPFLAKEWVEQIVSAINDHIRLQDRTEAANSIRYLEEQINQTNIAEMKSVFYELIEEQTKTLMLAEVSDEYVFKTISPAKVAEEETKPKKALISIIGTILGGMVSLIFVLVSYFVKNKRK